jgi:hypothetical protein
MRKLITAAALALTLNSTPAAALDHPFIWMLGFADARPVQVDNVMRTFEARARRISPDPNTADHVLYFAIQDVQNLGWQYQRYIHVNVDTIEGFDVWRSCTFVKPFNDPGRHISCQKNGVYEPWVYIPY